MDRLVINKCEKCLLLLLLVERGVCERQKFEDFMSHFALSLSFLFVEMT